MSMSDPRGVVLLLRMVKSIEHVSIACGADKSEGLMKVRMSQDLSE